MGPQTDVLISSQSDELQKLKLQIEMARQRRRAKLEAVEDYISFVITKGAGCGLLGSGVLEVLAPDVISAVLPQPASLAGIGFALLVGKKAAGFLVKSLETAKS